MKKSSKIISSFCLCLFLVSLITVCAKIDETDDSSANMISAEIDMEDMKSQRIITLPDGATLTPISQDEYISILAIEENIPYTEAYFLENPNTATPSRDGTTYYYNYSKNFTYSKNTNYKATLFATLKIWADGSYKQIENVTGVGSKIAAVPAPQNGCRATPFLILLQRAAPSPRPAWDLAPPVTLRLQVITVSILPKPWG